MVGNRERGHGFAAVARRGTSRAVPSPLRDLASLWLRILGRCPRPDREITVPACPVPRRPGAIPRDGTALHDRPPMRLRDTVRQLAGNSANWNNRGLKPLSCRRRAPLGPGIKPPACRWQLTRDSLGSSRCIPASRGCQRLQPDRPAIGGVRLLALASEHDALARGERVETGSPDETGLGEKGFLTAVSPRVSGGSGLKPVDVDRRHGLDLGSPILSEGGGLKRVIGSASLHRPGRLSASRERG